MPSWQGPLVTIGDLTGNSTITIDDRISKISSRPMWDKAVFALSTTKSLGSAYNVFIVGNLGGVNIPIAGISSIGSTLGIIIPQVQHILVGTAAGTTQIAREGIPTPRQIIFGNSATPGLTYSAVVYAMLQSED